MKQGRNQFSAAGSRAMLAALCVAMGLVGCKKDTVDTDAAMTKTPNVAAYARTMSEDEATQIVQDAEVFNQYAEDVAANNIPTQGHLPSSPTLDETVGLLENTFNYYYARITPDLIYTQEDSIIVPVSPNGEGQITLTEAIGVFNEARSKIHDVAELLANKPDIQLTLVDVERGQSGSVQTIKVFYTFEWQTGAEEEFGTESFPTGDNWHVNNKGGKQGTTLYDGKMGAPEVLAIKVRSGMGTSVIWANSAAMPVNIQDETVDLIYQSATPCISGASNNSNQYAVSNIGVENHKRMFLHSAPYSSNPFPNSGYILATGLNYYWPEEVAMCQAAALCTGKTFVNLKLTKLSILPNLNTIRTTHRADARYANVAAIKLPSVQGL